MSMDSKERYGKVTRTLHWAMAFFIGWQFLKFFDRIADGEHWVGENLVSWHSSVGAMILLLVILRVIWALKQKDNRPDNDPAVASLAKAGHRLLYAGMILLPITGMLYIKGLGYPIKAFGIQLFTGSGAETAWMIALGGLHSPIAWTLLIISVGHIGMALVHHFVKRDGVLQRML